MTKKLLFTLLATIFFAFPAFGMKKTHQHENSDKPYCKDALVFTFLFLPLTDLIKIRLVNKFFDHCALLALKQRSSEIKAEQNIRLDIWKKSYRYHSRYPYKVNTYAELEYAKIKLFLATVGSRHRDIDLLQRTLSRLIGKKNTLVKSNFDSTDPRLTELPPLIKKIKLNLALMGIDDSVLCIMKNFCLFFVCFPLTGPMFIICYYCVPTKTQSELARDCPIDTCFLKHLFAQENSSFGYLCFIHELFLGLLFCPFVFCATCIDTLLWGKEDECCGIIRKSNSASYTVGECLGGVPNEALEKFFEAIEALCSNNKSKLLDAENTCPWFVNERTKKTYENIKNCCPMVSWFDSINTTKIHQYYFLCTKKILPKFASWAAEKTFRALEKIGGLCKKRNCGRNYEEIDGSWEV